MQEYYENLIVFLVESRIIGLVAWAVVMDTIFGVARAVRERKLNSCFGIDGAIRKISMLVSIICLAVVDVVLAVNLIGFIPEKVRAYLPQSINTIGIGTAWKDKAYSTRTKECYDGKTYVNITDMFRAYDTISDAIEDYYNMLASCSRYRNCLKQTDPGDCITAIKNGGYATSGL
ncbi:MAG: phage holin family protein [Lachnospiraceae bacterium]|nr:phage holin family protein [Lachnospiraceae bacterium]